MIKVENLSKYYPVFETSIEGMCYLIQTAFSNHSYISKINHIKAIDDINLMVKPGEKVGIIGRNGSGKTTLLDLIVGGLTPTKGYIERTGDYYYLSSSTLSFEPELSARENIRVFLQKYSIENTILQSKLEEIENFLELDDYFDQPIKQYSLGMRARTEFAAATAVDASLILIDEILGAGDIYWVERCAERIEQYCKKGRSLVLISHSMGQILRYCERAIWLDKGKIIMDGSAKEVVRYYETYLEKLAWNSYDIEDKAFDTETEKTAYQHVTLEESHQEVIKWPGRGDITFNGVWINGKCHKKVMVDRNQPIEIAFSIKANATGKYSLRYAVNFWTAKGNRQGTLENNSHDFDLAKGATQKIKARIRAGILGIGNYYMSFTLFNLSKTNSTAIEVDARLDMIYQSIQLDVTDSLCANQHNKAYFSMPLDIRI